MLTLLSNLNMGASGIAAPVVTPTEDEGRDAGSGGPAWWEGEWRNPPRYPIPAERPTRPITPEQKEQLDVSLQVRAEAITLRQDIARLEVATEAIAPALEEAESRRAKQKLYNERSRLNRRKRKLEDELIVLEARAEQAQMELESLEWLSFLQAEDERFMRILLELI